ncbi:MAG: aminodeoxychorismate synthase component I [Chloroflexi bacterium]|nr:aminodeoxychorismate synthase component I [Chloroflexota bacterium]
MTNEVLIWDQTQQQWWYFDRPVEIIQAHLLGEVLPSLQRVEHLVNRHRWHAAGFLSYEAAPAFDSALRVQPPGDFPLLWFGLYAAPTLVKSPCRLPELSYDVGKWIPGLTLPEYDHAIQEIKAFIARGDTYQVNYTFRLRSSFSGDPQAYFHDLVHAVVHSRPQAGYTAYVETERFAICSASPELFFQRDSSHLVARPMKGTAARGRFTAEDKTQAQWLGASEKNRAENVMIVDMIRNDIGRIANYGTIKVPKLFEIERYPTVWQMTSTVTAETQASTVDIITALFPCASITGAPKARTMEIIARLEHTPRHVYTGAIGTIGPDRQATFNVAIRTVLVDKRSGTAEYGVGGGIVWDSTSEEEYAECLVKTQVLTGRRPDFALLETMLWIPADGYFLLSYHLQRLRDSASYFDYAVDLERVQAELKTLASSLPDAPHRVRLLAARDGSLTCQATPLPGLPAPRQVRLGLAPSPVDASNVFLYHKTTLRETYEAARAACPDCDDVLLWNKQGEITESTIANVIVKLAGQLVTPPVTCGLLPGTYRAWLLDQGKIREQRITLEMVKRAEGIFLINSVRKWQEVLLDIVDKL